jgi:hypothetical protein
VQVRSATQLFANGKYDGKLWDDAAKKDVAATYDPSQPWSETVSLARSSSKRHCV